MENTKQKKKKSEILNNQRRYDLRSNSVAKHKRDRYILASQASDRLIRVSVEKSYRPFLMTTNESYSVEKIMLFAYYMYL